MRRNRRARNGTSLIESAMWIPILVSLLFGMVELARVSYTYYTLHKILYNVGKTLGKTPLNFCVDEESITAIKEFALSGSLETGTRILPNLEADQIQVRLERSLADTGEIVECNCSSTGCDISQGGLQPEYIVISLSDGYPVQLTFPGLSLDPIPLRPQVRVPAGGG